MRAFFILCFFGFIASAASAAEAKDEVITSGRGAYQRAERFLSWNKPKFLLNSDIQHHWVDSQDRFWYRRDLSFDRFEFIIVDAATGDERPAFDHARLAAALTRSAGIKADLDRLPFSYFRFAHDGKAVVIPEIGRGWLCWLANSICEPITDGGADGEVVSPDGRWAAYLNGANIWIRSLDKSVDPFALTVDGSLDDAYASASGLSTYAISDRRARKPVVPKLRWSPDSRFILTYRNDERAVPSATLVQAVPDDGGFRPTVYEMRYATPGTVNPVVELIVLDIATRARVPLSLPELSWPGAATLFDRSDAWWAPDSRSFFYLDRDRYSKRMDLKSVPLEGGAKTLISERSTTIAYSNPNNIFDLPLVRTLSTGEIIWFSQRDGWSHLYLYDRGGRLSNQITKGPWTVRGIVKIDERDRTLYFTAGGRERGSHPYDQYLYRIGLDGRGLNRLTPEAGDHSSAETLMEPKWTGTLASKAELSAFSGSGRYFVDSFSSPNQPSQLVLREAGGTLVRRLAVADISALKAGGYVPVEPFQVLAADGKTPIYGNLYRPSHFDPAAKYPIIDSVYTAPSWIRSWRRFSDALFGGFEAQSLAELGFVVLTIDGRGTPLRSREFLDHSYANLQLASDLSDHVAAIKQLAERYPFIDITRVGVDGASAGGFGAMRALLAYPEFYKVGVAAEGNHDQRSYISTWGETYIGPDDAPAYARASNYALAHRLKGKLFLMHGEMDDNVSPTMTLRMANALIGANKTFDLLILPGSNHAAFANPYFIRRKWDFFVKNLRNADPPDDYVIRSSPQ